MDSEKLINELERVLQAEHSDEFSRLTDFDYKTVTNKIRTRLHYIGLRIDGKSYREIIKMIKWALRDVAIVPEKDIALYFNTDGHTSAMFHDRKHYSKRTLLGKEIMYWDDGYEWPAYVSVVEYFCNETHIICYDYNIETHYWAI